MNAVWLFKCYESLIRRIGSKEANPSFFIIFEYDHLTEVGTQTKARPALPWQPLFRQQKTYLQQCGNEILCLDNEDELATDVLYNLRTAVPVP